VKKETQQGSGGSKVENEPALNVEMRIYQQPMDALQASENKEATTIVRQTLLVPWLVLAVVLTLTALYVAPRISSGWVPADDGILAQSALRVMQGQLPQRDFAEIYTGGLSMIHALAFRLFGVNLMSLRYCALLFCLAWISAVYYITLRFTSPIAAGLITLVAVAWSYPNYPAAMPSWYNLYFATFGAAALLRYLDVRRTKWLFIAGVWGGVSILIKVIGAYYIAGALLFLAFLEQSDTQSKMQIDEPCENSAQPGKRAGLYHLFVATALLLFLATVVYVFHARLGPGEFYDFVLPSGVLVVAILLGERLGPGNAPHATTAKRFSSLLRLLFPFVIGVLLPVTAFLSLYAKSQSLSQLFSGVISSAIARSIGLGVIRPAGIEKSIYAFALLGVIAASIYWREFQGKLVGAAAVLGLTVILMKAATSGEIVSGVWYSAATLTPWIVLMGAAWVLTAAKQGSATKLQRQRIMVLISLAAVCTLVQYPFAAPIYFCYAAPLTLLALVAIVATAKKQPGTYVLVSLAGFYLLFGMVRLVPDHIYELTHQVGQMDELRLERAGGLHIEYAANFADLIKFLQQHSPNGLMYAGNDCPELYFLSGLKNVTRDDGGASEEDVLRALQSDNLKLVVINESPFFPSARMGVKVREEVERKFPQSQTAGIFHVYWRP